jgi:hypothetical protein
LKENQEKILIKKLKSKKDSKKKIRIKFDRKKPKDDEIVKKNNLKNNLKQNK